MNTSKRTVFSKIRDSRASRIVCAFLVMNILAELVSPNVALALTAGPASPEFSSFEPVGTTDMVNDFTGDFTYNIPILNVPGPDGGDYAMSMSYHSGGSSEEEASWVGFGWTLNPGAINRNKRGYPDEFKGEDIHTYSKVRPNWTQSANTNLNIEIKSKDGKEDSSAVGKAVKAVKAVKTFFGLDSSQKSQQDQYSEIVSFSLGHGIRYNNYTGFSISNSFGISSKGIGSLEMNRSGNQNTYGFNVNAIGAMGVSTKLLERIQNIKRMGWLKGVTKQMNNLTQKMKRNLANSPVNFPRTFAIKSYNTPGLSYSVAKNISSSYNFNTSVVVNPANFPVGGQIGFAGNLSVQANEAYQKLKAYGYSNSSQSTNWGSYGLLGHSNDPEDILYDYQIEKESTFSKNDKHLGIPFNNADIFTSTGSNVIGGFRLFHEDIGTYYPNFHTNITRIRQIGLELGLGADIELGLNLGIGRSTTKVGGDWPEIGSSGSYFPTFLNPEMRFLNDMGSEINYKTNNLPDNILNSTISILGNLQMQQVDYQLHMSNSKKAGSSKVEPLTNSSTTPSVNDMYYGMRITNKDGSKSNYTKPVYTKNEANLSVGIDAITSNYLVTKPLEYANPLDNNSVTGTIVDKAYANSFLLESNTSYNYIDVNNNSEPDEDDLGGWTKFDYRQVYGGFNGGDWYRYRTPYSGLIYNEGRLINNEDQTGSMSSGEKEVYYLKHIETKSHIAFFVTNAVTAANFTTNFPFAKYPYLYNGNASSPISSVTLALEGSGTIRYDGLDAAAITNGKDAAADLLSAKGTHHLERLEKIVLFAKSDATKPLTTTYFEYDYSLCQGIPNSDSFAPIGQKGKLTLKRVWTESNGNNRSQIAPYVFSYEYFNQYPIELTAINAPYSSWLAPFNNYPTNDANQNPVYQQEQLDAWGNYQLNGAQRFADKQPWLSQKTAPINFDPAAWQLKRIQLPSGGEIHIHYEQKDYSYVQDEATMAMVSLLPDDLKNVYESDEAAYAINEADLGLSTPQDVTDYLKKAENYFIVGRNKIYFKMLYNFKEDETPYLNTSSERYQYVTGYTTVNKITTTGGHILFHLGDIRDNVLTPILGAGKKDKTLPRYVCFQELMNNGGRNLGVNAGSYKDKEYTNEVFPTGTIYTDQSKVDKAARLRLLENTLEMYKDWFSGRAKNVSRKKACKALNLNLSYLKVPTYFAKKGGGIRVKRLLTYDKGIFGENGDAMLFGSEYSYVYQDGSSSGIATNEPVEMREENALVGYLERKKQKFLDKITNGRDTKQMEGPLGESILPAASVGYARVVVSNIHNNKSTTGFMVNQYSTCREFPMEVEYSSIKRKPGGGGTYKKFNLNLSLSAINLNINKAWITQGYMFKLNDMHGKLISKATYAGNYKQSDFNEALFTSKTINNYSEPGSRLSTLVYDGISNEFKREMLRSGTEEDYTLFTSNVTERTCDFNIEVDLNIIILGFFLGNGTKFTYKSEALRQHVTSKVVNLASYLKSTTSISDGVVQTTENIAFDRYTGDPVLTRTFDGYQSPNESIYTKASTTNVHKGDYYSFNIPAHWMYPTMGPKSINANNTNQLSVNAGNVVTYGENTMVSVLSNTNVNSWKPSVNPLTNVVSASATTFTNNWFTQQAALEFTALGNPTVLAKANTFYYPLRSYSYRDEVTDANAANNGKIYSGGIVSKPFNFFNWASNATISNEWYSDSKVTRYSPYGYPIEEEDVLGIKSSAKFGYNNMLPIYVAKNAAYSETEFMDFEYGTHPQITRQQAHTGVASFFLTPVPNYVFVQNYPLSANMITKKGLSVKFWLRSGFNVPATNSNFGLKNQNPNVKVKIGSQAFNMQAIAQTGEWTLYSAEIKNFYNLIPGNYPITLGYSFASNEEVHIDDFRLQPLDASMNCSVYYADKKIAAQFDDQHFAVMYEYNTKGQLTRKSIETTRGLKTLQEQQYNTPLKNR